MYVSLWGPHSLETSTLLPTLTDVVFPLARSDPLFFRYWYLFHHVGSFMLFVCAKTIGAMRQSSRESLRMRGRLLSIFGRQAYRKRDSIKMPGCRTFALSSSITP